MVRAAPRASCRQTAMLSSAFEVNILSVPPEILWISFGSPTTKRRPRRAITYCHTLNSCLQDISNNCLGVLSPMELHQRETRSSRIGIGPSLHSEEPKVTFRRGGLRIHATERGPDNCQCRVCRARPIAPRTSASRSPLASIFDLSFTRPSWRQKMYEFEGSEHSIPWSQRFCFGGSSRRYKLAEYVSLPSPVREPFYSS